MANQGACEMNIVRNVWNGEINEIHKMYEAATLLYELAV